MELDSKESEIEALSRKLCETARYLINFYAFHSNGDKNGWIS